MKKNLLSIRDLTAAEVLAVFDLAREMKASPEKFHHQLEGRMFGLVFEKPSTRTWVSFEVGIFSLGGGVIYLGPEDIKLGVREEVRDVARVLSRYLGGVILRTFSHRTITEFEKYFDKPIINGLSDFEHPCQALTDYFTLFEKIPAEKKPVLAFVGDGNNVLNSLVLLASRLGATLHYACPKGYGPNAQVLQEARASGGVIEGGHDPREAVRDADAVYTDVWVSMGEENKMKKKRKAFKGFQVNRELLKKARPHAFVMHCLPAHRGEEITDEVMESKHSIVFDQAENRLHVQKALLVHLCSAT